MHYKSNIHISYPKGQNKLYTTLNTKSQHVQSAVGHALNTQLMHRLIPGANDSADILALHTLVISAIKHTEIKERDKVTANLLRVLFKTVRPAIGGGSQM